MSVSQSRASRRLGVANPLRAGTTPPYTKGESWPSAGFPPVKLVLMFLKVVCFFIIIDVS